MNTVASGKCSTEEEIFQFIIDSHLILPILFHFLLMTLIHMFPCHHSRLPLLILKDIIGSSKIQSVFLVLETRHASGITADVVFHSWTCLGKFLHLVFLLAGVQFHDILW